MVHNIEACHGCDCAEWLDDCGYGQCEAMGGYYEEVYGDCDLNEDMTEKLRLGPDGMADDEMDIAEWHEQQKEMETSWIAGLGLFNDLCYICKHECKKSDVTGCGGFYAVAWMED
jgi:hypothetical protein